MNKKKDCQASGLKNKDIFNYLDEGALVWTPDGLYVKPAQDARFNLVGCLVPVGHSAKPAHHVEFEWLKPVKLCILCSHIYQCPRANANISNCVEFSLRRR